MRVSFRNWYPAETGTEEFGPLFQLVRLVRNTLHTNGVFLPEDEQAVSVEYGGETFDFRIGEPLTWLNDQRAIRFVQELALCAIVRSDVVRAIGYCPRG